MSLAIRVDNLSKRYLIGHRQERQEHFREMLLRCAAGCARRALHPFRTSTGEPFLGTGDCEDFWAIRDVSFDVRIGERVGIIGRNGAGKSTLLKILSRITEPTSGRIGIRGRVASLLEVGTGFHPELTGRENIFLNGAILGMCRNEIKQKFDRIVAFSGVERFLDTPVKRYSSGMKVRLAFAVAAHLDPDVLIVDEVLAVGDAAFQKKCLSKMDEVTKEGRTILLVSHNLSIVSSFCNRGILLDEGNMIFDGKVSAAVSGYLERLSAGGKALYEGEGEGDKPFVREARLLDCNDMPAKIVSSGERVAFVFEVCNWNHGVSCNFSIYNETGQKIVNFNTLNKSPLDGTSTAHRFICEVEELLLAEGRYRINIALIEGREMREHLEAALVFDVIASPLKDRLIANYNSGSSVLMHHRWTLPK